MVACPDCGTPNRADADLCAQCWRALSDDLISKIPVAAFASAGPVAPPPPPAQPPRAVPSPQPAPEPITPREATPGPVPYFVAAGSAGPSTAFIPSSQPVSAPATTTSSAPWGTLVALVLVLAMLGGGCYFFFGRSSGAFSPEDGSYSVELPEGWTPVEEVTAAQPRIDAAVQSQSEQAAIMAGHFPLPTPVTAEQFKAGMAFAKQYMPQFPGMTMGSFQDSTLVAGEGVSAMEMTAMVNGNAMLLPGGRGKMRMIMVLREGSPHFAMLVVACAESECATAEPAFEKMARTFEFSS